MVCSPRHRGRRFALAATLAVIGASLTGLSPLAAPAAAQAAATVSGEACAEGEGVTVVVDFTNEAGDSDVIVGCAPGEQATGLAALDAAGFTTGMVPSEPSLCTIDGVPAAGYPVCWQTGFWSYWQQGAEGEWAFATTGTGDGPVVVDSIMGLSWVDDWSTTDSVAPRHTVTLEPEQVTTTTEATTTTTEATTTTTEGTTTTTPTSTPEEPAACTVATPGAGGGADAALDWLACELEASGWLFTESGYPSWSPTVDALLALSIHGRTSHEATVTGTRALEDHVLDYVAGGDPAERYAGSVAKTLLLAGLQGEDVDDFGGLDLDDDLLGLMQAQGDDAGRFSDRSQYGDYSNGFGQAFAVLALSHTEGGVPPQAGTFLLDQQCPGGGFRLYYDDPGGCTDDQYADTDVTGLSLQALLTLPPSAGTQAAVDAAVDYLLGTQDPSGAFVGTGYTAVPNTNSTGLIAQGVRAAGQVGPADEAAAYVLGVQITGEPDARAGDGADVALLAAGPAATNLGAIAYDAAALAAARADGLTEQSLGPWRRATAQGVLALGAPSFGAPAPAAPVAPAVPSDPTDPDPTEPGAGLPWGGDTAGGGGAPGRLANTGAATGPLVRWGVVLVAAGAALVVLQRRRVATAGTDRS